MSAKLSEKNMEIGQLELEVQRLIGENQYLIQRNEEMEEEI